jgi:hypothetical protein
MEREQTDIVDRLRWKWADHGHGYNSDYTADLMEAADEIERLRGIVNYAYDQLRFITDPDDNAPVERMIRSAARLARERLADQPEAAPCPACESEDSTLLPDALRYRWLLNGGYVSIEGERYIRAREMRTTDQRAATTAEGINTATCTRVDRKLVQPNTGTSVPNSETRAAMEEARVLGKRGEG